MKKARRIYTLNPKELSPETIAVAFAKTSRSPKPFDEIAAELTDARSADFHEKWVVGYGHASVAEHAVLHLALENVSRLAIETIEANRLASYTEKSTRYQQWDPDAFYVPQELRGHVVEEDYVNTCQHLFQVYQDCIPEVKNWLRKSIPQQEDETDSAHESKVRTAAVDVCRFLLPAASLANVGVTINARALEYAICKMLSSPLHEVQAIGENLKQVAQMETPTLIKYAHRNDYLVSTRQKMRQVADSIKQVEEWGPFSLITYDADGENKILAAVLFRFGHAANYQSCLDFVKGLSTGDKKDLVEDLMGSRGPFDQPLREFEYAQMTFETVMDQGAYFEFKRHRMMTQTVSPLSPVLGFAIPKGITASGCEIIYRTAMQRAADLYWKLYELNPDLASYVIPNGFNRRVLFTMNLRECFNLCKLRAASNAHFSFQRIAQQIAEVIIQIYPVLGAYLDLPSRVSWHTIEDRFFSSLKTK